MWRIPVFLLGYIAAFLTAGLGSLWLGTVTVIWLGLVALTVGMTALVLAMFRALSWVIDGPRTQWRP